MYRVTKRDGSITEFHIAKIGNAITKAFEAVGRNHHPSVIEMLAQINGRDELPIPEKVQMDKIYCDNVSFVFDVKCLFMTVVSVFKHDGVVEGGTGAIADEE